MLEVEREGTLEIEEGCALEIGGGSDRESFESGGSRGG